MTPSSDRLLAIRSDGRHSDAMHEDCSSGASSSLGTQVEAWVAQLRGKRLVKVDALRGGAGARRYWRTQFAGGGSAVLMHARREDPAILPPALREESEALPFLSVTELLEGAGLPVPQIYGAWPAERWILLEDLGDRRLCDLPPNERLETSSAAVEILAGLHRVRAESALVDSRQFDAPWIRFELELFLNLGLSRDLDRRLRAQLENLVSYIGGLPRVLCHRDFQSQNLMLDPSGQLRMIDYQDALMAPRELDLAAFLFDAYVVIPDDARERLLDSYCQSAALTPDPGALAALTVQRKCKDFSRFRYLSRVKLDSRYGRFEASARVAVLDSLPRLPDRLSELGPLLVEAFEELGT